MAGSGATSSGKLRRIRRWLRWPVAAATALLLLIYAANVPFYAGGGLGPHAAWRMEHGRLRVTVQPSPRQEGFWIAPNSEGLRFGAQGRFHAADDWMVNVPLWAPLALAAGIAAWGFAAQRFGAGRCAGCGYELTACTVCPECGRADR